MEMKITSTKMRNHREELYKPGRWAEWKRAANARTRIYIHPHGETLIDNLMNRRTRPYNEYRKLLPDILTAVGLDPKLAESARWSQKAGCGCGCSPGFIINNDYGKSIWAAVTSKE